MSILTVASGQSVYRGYEYSQSKKVLHMEQCGEGVIQAVVSGSGNCTYDVFYKGLYWHFSDDFWFFYTKRQNSQNFAEKFCPTLDTLVSGSPIIQDGKLVGAATHILVNDPTTGYGIFIENMLDAAA